MCSQWILRCKYRIVNWKYETVGLGGNNLLWQMLCVCKVNGYQDVNVELLIPNKYLWELGG